MSDADLIKVEACAETYTSGTTTWFCERAKGKV